MILKIFADDLVSLAARKQAMPVLQGKVLGPVGDETLSTLELAGIKYIVPAKGWTADEMRLITAGDPGPINAKRPKKRIYIAFDREFVGLSVQPLGRVISVSGIGGEKLGLKHPAWPTEKSD